ncbi:YgaP family membrane protein [Pseudomonas sp. R1-7]|uniref:YgaP family membrane protein n=1 Tax=Pseudomonas sp. R1-7 TaxID=2817398 RepID=UPI003DA8398F
MSDNNPFGPVETTPFQSRSPQNVHGWERIGSLAGGVLMMGKGLRRGGVLGLAQLAIGGMALARGITGHCSAKSMLERNRQHLHDARARIEQAGDELSRMKANAQAATGTATVTGNDSLVSPKAGL